MQIKIVSRFSIMSFFNFFETFLPLPESEVARLLSMNPDELAEHKRNRREILGSVTMPTSSADIISMISSAHFVLSDTIRLHGLPNTRKKEIIGIIDGHSGSIEAMIRSGKPYLIQKATEMISRDFRCTFPQEKMPIDFKKAFNF